MRLCGILCLSLFIQTTACVAQHYPILPVPNSPHGIFTMMQDSKSALWLGTIDDVYRFDGEHFYSIRQYGFPVSVAGWPSRLRLGLFAHWYGAEDMPCQGCEWMGEAEAGRKKAHRFRSVEEKRRIVEETLKAGVSVSSVGRAHGINANQVFQWRKLYLQGLLDAVSGRDRMRLLPVAVSEEAESGTVAAPGATAIESPATADSSTGTIELSLGWGQLRIAGAVDCETLRTVLGCLLT